MLHITNGDHAAGIIRLCGIGGEVLPWRDVLHEGPVPAGLSLEELSEVRARFIADSGMAESVAQVRRDFQSRDASLRGSIEQDEVVLWFEADLYDQLQLIQILDWFSGRTTGLFDLSLICIGEHPRFERFDGLGQLTPEEMSQLFPARRPVSGGQLDLAARAWKAVTAPDPSHLAQLTAGDTTALEFLGPALVRLLEHYPFTTNGLDRTENQVLRVVASGATTFETIFPACAVLEERVFLGDTVLRDRIHAMADGPAPALSVGNGVNLTSQGRAYLEGRADFVRSNGIDRWVGGHHLVPPAPWRWNPATRTVGNYPT